MTELPGSPSPASQVWSIPHLASRICSHLSRPEIVTLLRVSKLHFQAAVKSVYNEIEREDYERSIARLQNSVRYHDYVGAVRIVKASEWVLDEPQKDINTDEWTGVLDPFPNAVQFDNSTGVLHRKSQDGQFVYTYEGEILQHVGDPALGTQPHEWELPSGRWVFHWISRLWIYDCWQGPSDWRNMSQALKDDLVSDGLAEAFGQAHTTIKTLYIRPLISSHVIFAPLQDRVSRGLTIPSILDCDQVDSDFLTMLRPLSHHFFGLLIGARPSEDRPNITMARFIRDFEPAEFTKLERLSVKFDINDDSEQPHIPIPPVSNRSSDVAGVTHLLIELASSGWNEMTQQQFELQLENLRMLARHLFPLFDKTNNLLSIHVDGYDDNPFSPGPTSKLVNRILRAAFCGELDTLRRSAGLAEIDSSVDMDSEDEDSDYE